MKIYANGCSFVMGQELVDNDPLNMNNKKTAWPSQIGAYNDAWSASSNHAIANRTMNHCRNNSVDIVIIGWSSPSRVLTFTQNERNDRLGQHTIKPTTATDVWEKYFASDTMHEEWSQNVIESLYYWLEANKIMPIFFQSFIRDYKCNVPMLWEGDSWQSVYAREHDLDIDYTKHPNQSSHNWLADYLKQYIDYWYDIHKSKTS